MEVFEKKNWLLWIFISLVINICSAKSRSNCPANCSHTVFQQIHRDIDRTFSLTFFYHFKQRVILNISYFLYNFKVNLIKEDVLFNTFKFNIADLTPNKHLSYNPNKQLLVLYFYWFDSFD